MQLGEFGGNYASVKTSPESQPQIRLPPPGGSSPLLLSVCEETAEE